MSGPQGQEPGLPEDLPLPSMRLSSDAMQTSYEAVAERPSDPEGHTTPAPPEVQDPRPRSHRDPKAERRSELAVAAFFLLSLAGSLLFCAAYLFVDLATPDYGQLQNVLLATGLGCASLGLSLGLIVLSKTLAPNVIASQERSEHHSPEEDELAAERQLVGGVREIGLAQRRMVRRTLLAALGALPLPLVFGLRGLGPRPKDLLWRNSWRTDSLLLNSDSLEPIRLGDLEIGELVTVVPETGTDTTKPVAAESVVVLIHLEPGVNRPRPGRETWAAEDHIAYSKICTHAGCPVGLYEQQTHHLLCPCHQSTFDVTRGCKIIFGPAPRPLPQLPIYVDGKGYFRAQRPFGAPLGPSFWERTSPS